MLRKCFVLALVCLSAVSVYGQSAKNLVLVWAQENSLHYMRGDSDIATFPVQHVAGLHLSPDGTKVAYTSGTDSTPESLWLVGIDADPVQIVNSEQIDGAFVDQVAWLDNDNILFNTSQFVPPLGITALDNLYQADADSGTFALLLDAGEGGAFTVSPDGEKITLVRAGTFNDAGEPDVSGDIRLLENGEVTLLHTFQPIETASHNGYYPPVTWRDNSELMLVALPSAIFAPEIDTALSELRIDGTSTQIGSVNTGYGNLLAWSSNGEHLYYGSTPPSATQGSTLVVADFDGTNGETVAEDQWNGLVWSEKGTCYAYIPDFQTIAIGTPENPTFAEISLESSTMSLDLRFIDDNTLVYVALREGFYELNRVSIHEDGSVEQFQIARHTAPMPFDAVVTE